MTRKLRFSIVSDLLNTCSSDGQLSLSFRSITPNLYWILSLFAGPSWGEGGGRGGFSLDSRRPSLSLHSSSYSDVFPRIWMLLMPRSSWEEVTLFWHRFGFSLGDMLSTFLLNALVVVGTAYRMYAHSYKRLQLPVRIIDNHATVFT